MTINKKNASRGTWVERGSGSFYSAAAGDDDGHTKVWSTAASVDRVMLLMRRRRCRRRRRRDVGGPWRPTSASSHADATYIAAVQGIETRWLSS